MQKVVWHNLTVNEVLDILHTSKEGLDAKEAENRLQKYGPNKLPERQPITKWMIFLNQFKSPLVSILFFAAVITMLLQNWLDFSIIMVVVLTNAVIGFFQENKANNSIVHLKKLIQYKAKVLRDGHKVIIPTEFLVPGDIIFLEAGDKVPADARLIQVNALETIEASLTGESTPAKKQIDVVEKGAVIADRKNFIFLGTVVSRGKGTAVVCETGLQTELGKIATMIYEEPEEKTPLQIQLQRLSRFLTFTVIIVSIFIVILGIISKKSLFESINGHESGILYTAIALAVSAIPEGLLIAVTVILAVGMQRILKKKSLIRRLIATETLGSTSVICTDKTGTLTEGRMLVTTIALPEKIYDFQEVLKEKERKAFEPIFKTAILCNDAEVSNPQDDITQWRVLGDTTDSALLLAAVQFGYNKEMQERKNERIDEIPFNSINKYSATLNYSNDDKAVTMYVKGSPEKILDLCQFVDNQGKRQKITSLKRHLSNQLETMTRSGLRVLALAYRNTNARSFQQTTVDKLTFQGFIGIKDPLRKETRKMFHLAQKAGIRTVIVTGDHKLTALSIAKEIGMNIKDENVLEGKDLDTLSDASLKKVIKHIKIFSRVNPHHKLKIINSWQSLNEVVAMTGDGVNDAPALKSADVGIALNSGTDVAKENADIILLDNNFRTIIDAVKEGRIIFDNIRKVTLYVLSDSFAEVTLITASLILQLPLPILPVQILWINLIDDGLPAMAMALEPGEEDVLDIPPRKKHEPVLNTEMKILIGLISFGVNIFLFFVFYWLLSKGKTYTLTHIRTIIFSTLALSTLFYVYSCRSLRKSILHRGTFSNRFLHIAVLIGISLQILAIYEPHLQKAFDTTPLNLFDWSIVIAFSLLSIIFIEVTKYLFINKKMKN